MRRGQRPHTRQRKAYPAFPDVDVIARTPVIPGVNDDDEHIRSVLASIRPHPNVIDYQLLPYHRFGASKYGFLGRVYELADFTPPTDETMHRLRALIDDAFHQTPAAEPAHPGAHHLLLDTDALATHNPRDRD